jgi:hypothetical protein
MDARGNFSHLESNLSDNIVIIVLMLSFIGSVAIILNPNMSWGGVNNVTDCGQKTVVVSAGEVELYYDGRTKSAAKALESITRPTNLGIRPPISVCDLIVKLGWGDV